MNDKAGQIEINSIAASPYVIIVGLKKGSIKPKVALKLTRGLNGDQLQEMFAAIFELAATALLNSGTSTEGVKEILLDQINDAINRVSQINKDTTIH